MSLKKKIYYNAAVLVVTFLLLLALTLSWFFENTATNIKAMETFVASTYFEIEVSQDEDDDGLPDREEGEEGEEGEIIYVPMVTDRIEFRYIYPGYTVAFKVTIKSASSQSLGGMLREVTPPEQQNLSSESSDLDLAKAMKVSYKIPGSPVTTVDTIYNLFISGTRDAELFSNLVLNATGDVTFYFSVYMDEEAMLKDYKDKKLEMSASFFVEN